MPKYRSVEDLAAPLLREIEEKFSKK